MTVTQLTAADVALTQREEGLVLHRYWDPYGEVWTIGYGTTSGAGVVNPIPPTCTEQQALDWLLEYMNRDVVPAILAVFTPATGGELGGLADMGYNCGSGVFREEPLYSALRSGNRAAIGEAMLAFDRAANGEVISALVNRRQADRDLFLSGGGIPTPTHVKSMHYDRYPPKWQKGIKRYDELRELVHTGKISAHERVWYAGRRVQMRRFSRSVARKAHRERLHSGKPSWSVNKRGWMFQQLNRRARGRRCFPTT